MAKRSKRSIQLEEKFREACRAQAQRYLKVEGVTSIGVGYHIKDGVQTDDLCIQITVEQKLEPEQLEAREIPMLPESISYEGDTFPVDIVERTFEASFEILDAPEELTAHQIRRNRQQTMRPGISVSHTDGTAGTLGAIVYDKTTGEPYVLSNWHVLHGDTGEIGDTIVQPGPFDSSQIHQNECGSLVRSHLGMAGDCAISSIENREFSASILERDVIPQRTAKVHLGDKVVKSGRTTGVTFGIVNRVDVVVNLNYGDNVGTKQIGGFEIGPDEDHPAENNEISKGGDSGSTWLINDDDEHADIVVGLHFAGEASHLPDTEYALACNIHSVCDILNVTFIRPEEADSTSAMLRMILDWLASLEGRLGTEAAAGTCSCEGAATGKLSVTAPNMDRLGVPVYGNWCGPGHGGGTPVDDVDRACMIHDQCYGSQGYFNCGCDVELIRNLNRALDSGGLGWRAKIMGRVIRAYFRRSPCRD